MKHIIENKLIIDAQIVEEIWVCKNPKMGDHIRVDRASGLYNHHGIYVADAEIIHFTGDEDDSVLDWSKSEVIKSDLEYFLKNGVLKIKEYTDGEYRDLYPAEQIVAYARACLGDKDYNLLFNNCEHFANVCTLGRFSSKQVEKLLLDKGENENMSIWSIMSNWLGFGSKSSGSRSTSTTTYEPDKVKVVEIEADTKIRLANMELERIELMKQARLDILQFETESQIALEQARAQGLSAMAYTIMAMQEKLTEVAEKRLLIIEKGSLQIIKETENFYNELEEKIKEDLVVYNSQKLPELLSILEKYDEGTPAHNIYMSQIDEDRTLQIKRYLMQCDAISKRQTQIIEGFLHSKERIIEQTGQITAGMLESIRRESALLGNLHSNTSIKQMPQMPNHPLIEGSKPKEG